MPVSAKTLAGMQKSSWIRQMFEAGEKLKLKLGKDNVFDVSIGNPVAEPPPEFKQELIQIARKPVSGMHRYMPNSGYMHTRNAVAKHLSAEFGLNFGADDIIMTCGAAGALNIALKTVLNPGDEVIVISPYFPEYLSYIDNHSGRVIVVVTRPDFVPSIDELHMAIGPATRGVIINSPNNPTGIVYSDGFLNDLAQLLKNKSSRFGQPVYLISDEPYRRIIYDGAKYPAPVCHYTETLITSSYSKDLSLPGERIGYLAVNPNISDREELVAGMVYSNRILGFVNAPALMQYLVSGLQTARVSVDDYQRKRDYFYQALQTVGYEVLKPAGAFYMFPKTPVDDDVAFVKQLMEFGVLAVPGSGFGCPGYMRLSFCVDDKTIEGAITGLNKAIKLW